MHVARWIGDSLVSAPATCKVPGTVWYVDKTMSLPIWEYGLGLTYRFRSNLRTYTTEYCNRYEAVRSDSL